MKAAAPRKKRRLRTPKTLAEYRAMKLAELDEIHDFMPSLIKDMRTLGWHVYHTWNSINSEDGFPDIIAIRGNRLIVFECKRVRLSKKDDPTPAQIIWLDEFRGVERIDVDLVRPTDLDKIDALII